MKKHRKLLMLLVLSVIFVCLFATPAFAITESEVQTQVDTLRQDGHLWYDSFLWTEFLCTKVCVKKLIGRSDQLLYSQLPQIEQRFYSH